MTNNYDIVFSDYHFNNNPGIFTCKLQKKLKTKNGNMSIFVQTANGDKIQITLFPDNNFLGIDDISVGEKIKVEFVVSRNNRVYAKSISAEG